MARSLLPGADEETLAEINLQLTSRRDRARAVAYPSVSVSEAQVEKVLSQCMPLAMLLPGARPVLTTGGAARRGGGGSGGEEEGGAAALLAALARAAEARLGWTLPWPLRPPRARGSLPAPQLISWHAQRQWLAVGHAAADAALIYDLDAAPSASVPDCVEEAALVLTHELQSGLSSLAWRPVHCTMLAAGCRGGVVLWALGRQPAGGAGFQRAAAGGNGNGGGAGGAVGGAAWASFLRYSDGCSVTALAWSPDGRLLAGAGPDSSRLVVWDAALGAGAVVRLGLDPLTLLRWSPCGGYLFAAGAGGRFHVAETATWRTAAWAAPAGGHVAAAAWAPSGRAALVAFGGGSGAGGVVALHFVGASPSLTEQLLPVTLPEVTSLDVLKGGPLRGGCIADLAWDPSGRRLAALLRPPHPAAGLVAVFATSVAPVAHAELLGFACAAKAGDGGAAAALAFAPRAAKGGALLSVMVAGGAGEVRVANIALAR
ncbi:hypothetical protein Rsub_02524 [Raphidocelis subcapitata]|uniref:Aladin n=1 Tax=Raphidocelis subcapitata TaxID=307507 RepID=A0A2V0NW77_9CHLO|nr:hypothetical protein Rsub_02524 [Raphidocelis subcapitata]|eukprot:GBF89820.1 hypothetical protein Rsub_02524 [Raphidocelis subcapitata]